MQYDIILFPKVTDGFSTCDRTSFGVQHYQQYEIVVF